MGTKRFCNEQASSKNFGQEENMQRYLSHKALESLFLETIDPNGKNLKQRLLNSGNQMNQPVGVPKFLFQGKLQ